MNATIGDNSRNLTPAEQRALYMFHFNEISAQHARVKAEQAIEKTLRRQAKAKGIVLADIDFGMRCAEVDDPQIVADELERRNMIARFFALPVGTQPAFDFQRDTKMKKAAREGAAAGYRNAEAKPPYDVASKEGQEWMRNYNEARAQSANDLAAALQKVGTKPNGEAGEEPPDAEFEDGDQ